MQEVLSDLSLSSAQGSDEVLAEEARLVSAAKKAALLVAGAAYQKFQSALAEQQEVVAAVSDMVMEAFAMESVVLRARKIAHALGEERAGHAARMARLWVHARLDWIELRARTALAALAAGDALRAHLAVLRRLIRRDAVDSIALRRQIAAHVIAQGKYVV